MEEVTMELMGPAEFFEVLYKDQEGYIYVATKDADIPSSWNQSFFRWPSDRDRLTSFVESSHSVLEVFHAPAIFQNPTAKKISVQSARVLWVEFDGTIPTDLGSIPEPSLRIQSSVPGHEHWYWFLDRPLYAYDLEKYNRSLAYALGADISGWDANQVLRPPGTFNHKRKSPVRAIGVNDNVYDPEKFVDLPTPPPVVNIPDLGQLPDPKDIIYKYKFPPKVQSLMVKGVEVGSRSEGLVALGYHLAEMQLSSEEIYTLLEIADRKWGKYHNRPDKQKRLLEIVTRARAKYPLVSSEEAPEALRFPTLGVRSLLAAEYKLEWVWEGFLQKAGSLILAGKSGVGKTQFSLFFASQLALGKPCLGAKTHGPMKILFFSLEMTPPEIKHFISILAESLSDEELDTLEENLLIVPIGEPLFLTQAQDRKRVEHEIVQRKVQGVILDSLGMAGPRNLSHGEEEVKDFMDWDSQLRKRTGCFMWYIHHNRKSNGETEDESLDAIYGSQWIPARVTTALVLERGSAPNRLWLKLAKVRLAKIEKKKIALRRSSSLTFAVEEGMVIEPEEEDAQATEDEGLGV